MQSQAVKSAKRTMEILEMMEAVRRPVSLKDVSARLGYPTSSSSVLLKSLVQSGYLHYDRFTRTYLPTTRLTALGHWIPDTLFSRADIIGAMSSLHERTGRTVAVGAMADATVQYLHVIGTSERGRLASGASQPLDETALGLVLLGALNDRIIETVWRRAKYANTNPARPLATLLAQVGKVRAEGHALVSTEGGMATLAMLVPGEWHGRMLGLCVSSDAGGMVRDFDHILSAMACELRKIAEATRPRMPDLRPVPPNGLAYGQQSWPVAQVGPDLARMRHGPEIT